MIITDMGRGEEPDAGLKFLKEVRSRFNNMETPIIVYASKGAINNYGKQALDSGAVAAVDGLSDIINYISKYIN